MTMLVSSSFTSQVCASSALTAHDRAAMFGLLSRHFDGVVLAQFERDLAEKNWTLRIFDATGQLVGFSTMLVYETVACRRVVSVVCSGDTVLDPSAWSSPALPREWITAVNRLRADYPNGPYYWMLITSGFRTYRLLSTFWATFYPRHDTTPPPVEQALLDALYTERFGNMFDPATGVVRFHRPQVLRPHLSGIPPERLSDPHVAFFARRNPGHVKGDELACLCELSEQNLTRAGRRMVFGPEPRQP
jgi:hypothetical protein